ncbi:IS4 family transposase [Rhizosphaericola mali]|uniref:IS4 family transposase n=1 Tax=Rhizosphaericola mali TaxID=2545455 RepID=A0A5P2GAC0_9BACT|nr:IS4 family transposase [Rhizosphaericola mali]QES88491.1 IS4 family transposase [Rhizosphaericola mali]
MDKVMNYVGQPIFAQVLSLIDDNLISSACQQHKADKYSKKLCFKDHLTTMLYCIFARCTNLREVEAGLELCNGKLNHLDLKKVPARSTLSDGNKKRTSEVFATLYQSIYQKYKHIISDSPLKPGIASKLYILDSSTISLFKAILKPAGRKRLDGRSKGGYKVHTLLKADNNMPSFVKSTAAAMHDQQFYECIKELPDGSIITFDKAYVNYQQFEKFNERGVSYVVPQKENAQYHSIRELELKDEEPNILKDELILVGYNDNIEQTSVKRTLQLRRVAYYSQKHKTAFIYWTNNIEMAASDIVAIYQNRWQIEKFFKKLKQNFPLNYFLGDNENAIQIQIWCALIGLVLLQVLYQENKATMAFSTLASIVSLHLMTYLSIAAIILCRNQKRVRKKPPKNNLKHKQTKTDPYLQTKLNF